MQISNGARSAIEAPKNGAFSASDVLRFGCVTQPFHNTQTDLLDQIGPYNEQNKGIFLRIVKGDRKGENHRERRVKAHKDAPESPRQTLTTTATIVTQTHNGGSKSRIRRQRGS